VGNSTESNSSQPTQSSAPPPQQQSSSGDSGGGGGGSDGGGGGDIGSDPEPLPVAASQKQGAVARIGTVKANLSLIPQINAAFRSVFGRNPTVVENGYWLGRVKRGEKQTDEALRGAMAWHRGQGQTIGSSSSIAGAMTRDAALVPKINAMHRRAYGRNPTGSEHAYWLGRVASGDKTSEIALLGAMLWHRLAGITP
jgi:hypothetical protein